MQTYDHSIEDIFTACGLKVETVGQLQKIIFDLADQHTQTISLVVEQLEKLVQEYPDNLRLIIILVVLLSLGARSRIMVGQKNEDIKAIESGDVKVH